MTHLCVYRFDPGASFVGGIIGAIERADLLGSADVLDGIFVRRDASSGELEAMSLGSPGDNRFVALSDFRLDPARRRKLTEATLAAHPEAEGAGATLEPGAALLAVLIRGETPDALADAVARAGGRLIADEPSDAPTIEQAAPRLLDIAGSAP